MTQACRDSGVVDSSPILASTCAWVTATPSCAARPDWIRASISRSSTVVTSGFVPLWLVWAWDWIDWIWACASALVLRDRLAIDGRSRREMVAVELDDRHPDEDRDGDCHCQAETNVEVEIAP